ncbi:MAG: tRNA (adenosine(37)-N6)-dimethylallyltransferase MiaA [Crocinitomicaceae bacterium]|nr:tRNA (adenosine(37)-N6)-dimethylallyltransferase MiaA [Crocinitomicaceae bacterium]
MHNYLCPIKHLIVISGPTASGKTSLSIAVAKHFNTSIISADSRQFYKELSIGTAKPSVEEQDGVTHYFIDSHSIKDEVTSYQFEEEAMKVLQEELESKDVVVLVGGSGMFIDALCIGLDNIPNSAEVKLQIQKELEENGLEPLLVELMESDPEYYEQVDKSNAMRIERAIEVIRLTGEKFSDLRKQKPSPRPFKVHRIVLNHDREVLYNRINLRVDLMMKAGLLEEAQSVQNQRHLSSLNTVGYKELFTYLDGHSTLEEAVEKIKQNTRRYAKRQLTWLRRHPESQWINHGAENDMLNAVINYFEKNQ